MATSRSRKKRVKSRGGVAFTNRWVASLHQWHGLELDLLALLRRSDGRSPPVISGDREVIVAGANRESVDVTIRQAQPLPLTVLGAVVKYDTYGD